MTKKRQYREFKDTIQNELRDPEFAVIYLEEAFNSSIESKNKNVFLLALKDVIEARSDITTFAKRVQMPRQNVYRMLSEDGNPTFENILTLVGGIDVEIMMKPK